MAVLLRLIENSGVVTVDGVNIAQIPRTVLRQRCFITIPQECFFMDDITLRSNLDPEEESSDELITSALRKVKLWTHLLHRHGTGTPLASSFSAFSSLSAGQKQLLALARALIRREVLHTHYGIKAILLLDEATSWLDPDTEQIMQDVIDEEFTQREHTVIMITHRPHVMASRMREGQDVVVWMRDGRIGSVSSRVENALL